MKIDKRVLKKIIREEIENVLAEEDPAYLPGGKKAGEFDKPVDAGEGEMRYAAAKEKNRQRGIAKARTRDQKTAAVQRMKDRAKIKSADPSYGFVQDDVPDPYARYVSTGTGANKKLKATLPYGSSKAATTSDYSQGRVKAAKDRVRDRRAQAGREDAAFDQAQDDYEFLQERYLEEGLEDIFGSNRRPESDPGFEKRDEYVRNMKLKRSFPLGQRELISHLRQQSQPVEAGWTPTAAARPKGQHNLYDRPLPKEEKLYSGTFNQDELDEAVPAKGNPSTGQVGHGQRDSGSDGKPKPGYEPAPTPKGAKPGQPIPDRRKKMKLLEEEPLDEAIYDLSEADLFEDDYEFLQERYVDEDRDREDRYREEFDRLSADHRGNQVYMARAGDSRPWRGRSLAPDAFMSAAGPAGDQFVPRPLPTEPEKLYSGTFDQDDSVVDLSEADLFEDDTGSDAETESERLIFDPTDVGVGAEDFGAELEAGADPGFFPSAIAAGDDAASRAKFAKQFAGPEGVDAYKSDFEKGTSWLPQNVQDAAKSQKSLVGAKKPTLTKKQLAAAKAGDPKAKAAVQLRRDWVKANKPGYGAKKQAIARHKKKYGFKGDAGTRFEPTFDYTTGKRAKPGLMTTVARGKGKGPHGRWSTHNVGTKKGLASYARSHGVDPRILTPAMKKHIRKQAGLEESIYDINESDLFEIDTSCDGVRDLDQRERCERARRRNRGY